MFKVAGGTTRVANVNRSEVFDVLIDRTTPWGNPFKVPRFDLATSIDNYRIQLLAQRPDMIANLYRLKGKILGCHCKPKDCHGDVLAFLADWWLGPEGKSIKQDPRLIPITATIRVYLEKEKKPIGHASEAMTFDLQNILYPKIKPLSFPITRIQAQKLESLVGMTERQWLELDMQYWLKKAEATIPRGSNLIIN